MTAVPTFTYKDEDFIIETKSLDSKQYELSEFDKMIQSTWDKAMQDGYFRYNLDSVRSRVVPGKYGYYLQLNTKRGRERRRPEYIDTLKMAYDPNRFNFTKVKEGEIICEFNKKDADTQEGLRNVIMINVSPLSYGHILLAPHVDKGIPQKLTQHGVSQALDMVMLSSHPGFRVGFNSLCALASVNHQHVHAWYLEQPIYTQTAPVKDIHSGIVYETTDLVANAFVFQLYGTSVQSLADRVFRVVNYLQENEIAHNLFITRGSVFGVQNGHPANTVRVYVWARKKTIGAIFDKAEPPVFAQACVELACHVPMYGEKNEIVEVFNFAVAECACHVPCYGVKNEVVEVCNFATAEFGGQIPMFVEELFDDLTEKDIMDRIRPHVLPEDEMKTIRENICALFPIS